jgi:hypothetical protein
VAGSCEHDDEPTGSVKDGEFLDNLNDSLSRRTLVPLVTRV